MNPCVHTDTSFPGLSPAQAGWLPTRLGDPGSEYYPAGPDLRVPPRRLRGTSPNRHRGNKMHQNWLQRSENTIKQLKQLMDNPDQDRLELVRVMRFAFGALGTSLAGWMQWINSPEIMSSFNQEELQEMAKTITGMVEQFVAYDIDITDTGTRKGLAKQRANDQHGVRFVI